MSRNLTRRADEQYNLQQGDTRTPYYVQRPTAAPAIASSNKPTFQNAPRQPAAFRQQRQPPHVYRQTTSPRAGPSGAVDRRVPSPGNSHKRPRLDPPLSYSRTNNHQPLFRQASSPIRETPPIRVNLREQMQTKTQTQPTQPSVKPIQAKPTPSTSSMQSDSAQRTVGPVLALSMPMLFEEETAAKVPGDVRALWRAYASEAAEVHHGEPVTNVKVVATKTYGDRRMYTYSCYQPKWKHAIRLPAVCLIGEPTQDNKTRADEMRQNLKARLKAKRLVRKPITFSAIHVVLDDLGTEEDASIEQVVQREVDDFQRELGVVKVEKSVEPPLAVRPPIQSLPNPATFSKDIVPTVTGNPKLQEDVGRFLSIFLRRFDQNRSSLEDLYATDAAFSHTVISKLPYRSQEGDLQDHLPPSYQQDARNCAANYELPTSGIPIINMLRRFPVTDHFTHSTFYHFDCWQIPGRLLGLSDKEENSRVQVVVRGVAQDFTTKQFWSYVRNFLLVAIPSPRIPDAPFKIINDQLIVRPLLSDPKSIPQQGAFPKELQTLAGIATPIASPVIKKEIPPSPAPTSIRAAPIRPPAPNDEDAEIDELEEASNAVETQEVQRDLLPVAKRQFSRAQIKHTVNCDDKLPKTAGHMINRSLIASGDNEVLVVRKRGDVLAGNRLKPNHIRTCYDATRASPEKALDIRDAVCLRSEDSYSCRLIFGLATACGPQKSQIAVVRGTADRQLELDLSTLSLLPAIPHTPYKASTTGGITGLLPLVSSEDSWNFLTGGTDHHIFHWSITEGDKITTTEIPIEAKSAISALASTFDRGGSSFVAGSHDKSFTLYDGFTALQRVKLPHAVFGAEFCPTNNNLLALEVGATFDQVQLFDIRQLRPQATASRQQTLSFHSNKTLSQLTKGAFSPDGVNYAIGDDAQLMVFDLRNPTTPLKAYTSDAAIVRVHWESPSKVRVLEKKNLCVVDLY